MIGFIASSWFSSADLCCAALRRCALPGVSRFGEVRNVCLLAGYLAVTYGAGMLQGREAEQRRLDELLGQARAGRSAVLVLRGEPGIGKTALLGYAASRAEGMQVLSAAG